MVEFPQTNDAALQRLWQEVLPYLNALPEHRQAVIDASPPTQGRITEWVATTDDAYVLETLESIRNLQDEVAKKRKELEDYAYEKLSKACDPDTRIAARQRFNATRTKAAMMLHSISAIAAHKGEMDIVDFCTQVLDGLPSLSNPNRAASSDTKKAREWLRKHHPELNIGSRGKVPEEYLTLYYNRDSD